MRTKAQQEALYAARCRHYGGSANSDKCQAGVCYLDFNGGKREGSFITLPCWGPNGYDEKSKPGKCPSYSPLTASELADEKHELHMRMRRMGEIREAIVTALGGPWTRQNPKGGAGTIPCPCCAGTVHYSRAGSNGHVHAQCTTKGCASWME